MKLNLGHLDEPFGAFSLIFLPNMAGPADVFSCALIREFLTSNLLIRCVTSGIPSRSY